MYSFNLKSIKPRRFKIPANRKNANKDFCCFVVVIVVDVSSFFVCVFLFVYLFVCFFFVVFLSLAYVFAVLQLCMSGVNNGMRVLSEKDPANVQGELFKTKRLIFKFPASLSGYLFHLRLRKQLFVMNPFSSAEKQRLQCSSVLGKSPSVYKRINSKLDK